MRPILKKIYPVRAMMIYNMQGSVQVFYPGSYFCETIVIFVNFIVIFVNFILIFVNYFYVCEKLHTINFIYWIEIKHYWHKKKLFLSKLLNILLNNYYQETK